MKTATKKRGKSEATPKALQLPPGVEARKDAVLAGEIKQIPLSHIAIVGKHDRDGMSDAELKIDELAQSIAAVGLQQPIHVAHLNGDKYALVFGERRLRACRMLKQETISAVVTLANEQADDNFGARHTAEARAVENIQRLDPSPIGEAVAIADLFEIKQGEVLDEYKKKTGLDNPDPTISALVGFRQEAIRRTAERVGKPLAWVRDRVYLSSFSGQARELVSSGRLPLAHAKEIAKVADPRRRDELAEQFAAGPPGSDNSYAFGEDRAGDIEDLRDEVAKSLWSLSQVPWNLDQAFAGKPACEECPHNSRNTPGLFEGKTLYADDPKQANKFGRWGAPDQRAEPKAGICQKPECYKEKNQAASRALSGTVSKVLNRFEPAKAAKKQGANKLLELAAIRDLTPAFVSPFVVKERVQARLESKSEKKPAAKKSTAPTRRPGDYGTPEYEAKQKAVDKYHNAAHHWQDKIATPAFAKYLQEEEGRWAMYALVQRSKPYEKACHWNAKPKDFESPELRAVLRLIANPSMDAVLKIQEYCGMQFGLLELSHAGGRPNQMFMHAIVKTMGIEIPPPPDEAAFVKEELTKFKIAQENKANIAAANGRGGKKSAAKKGAKSKAGTNDQEGGE